MSKTQKPDAGETVKQPRSITAAEFDAGEDISEYIDWGSGVWAQPDKPAETDSGRNGSISD